MVIIRPATLEDAPSIAVVHVKSWQSTYRGIIDGDYLAALSLSQRAATWTARLKDLHPPNFTLVAQAGGQIVGFVAGGSERTGDVLYRGEVYALYLLDTYQRQGVGKALMQAAAADLLYHGFTTMLVWVLAENPARHFYAAMGGKLVYNDKTIQIGAQQLAEWGYGWLDITHLAQGDSP